MPTLSREACQRRIAKDDGDRSDGVIRIVNNGRQSCYHADEDCEHVVQANQTDHDKTRGWCQDHEYAPCKRCILGTAKSGPQDSLGNKLLSGEVSVDHDFAWDANSDGEQA